MKISGKRKTVIPGRFPTIFPSQNTTKDNGSSQFEENSNLGQSNITDNIRTGFDNNVLSALEVNSDSIHADFQAANDICSIVERENISELGDHNNGNYQSPPLGDETEQISTFTDSNTK